jgi:hypothetical protein
MRALQGALESTSKSLGPRKGEQKDPVGEGVSKHPMRSRQVDLHGRNRNDFSY